MSIQVMADAHVERQFYPQDLQRTLHPNITRGCLSIVRHQSSSAVPLRWYHLTCSDREQIPRCVRSRLSFRLHLRKVVDMQHHRNAAHISDRLTARYVSRVFSQFQATHDAALSLTQPQCTRENDQDETTSHRLLKMLTKPISSSPSLAPRTCASHPCDPADPELHTLVRSH
jgi:hypothetical protein